MTAVESAEFDLTNARAARDAVAQRRAALLASVEAIQSDLVGRRAALAALAEDGEAFRAALAFISAEEDRERALVTVVLPEADAQLRAQNAAVELVAARLARARAVVALHQMFEADQAFAKVLLDLEAALEQCTSVRDEIREIVHAAGSDIRPDARDLRVLNWFLPVAVRRHFSGFPFNDGGVVYKPDVVAWHAERLQLSSEEVTQ